MNYLVALLGRNTSEIIREPNDLMNSHNPCVTQSYIVVVSGQHTGMSNIILPDRSPRTRPTPHNHILPTKYYGHVRWEIVSSDVTDVHSPKGVNVIIVQVNNFPSLSIGFGLYRSRTSKMANYIYSILVVSIACTSTGPAALQPRR